MSDEELRIRAILGTLPLEERLRAAEETIAHHSDVLQHVPTLLNELEWLRAENAALRDGWTRILDVLPDDLLATLPVDLRAALFAMNAMMAIIAPLPDR